MFCDMREDMLDDLKDLGDVLQGGLSNHVKKNFSRDVVLKKYEELDVYIN